MSNCLAAIGVALSQQIPLELIALAVPNIPFVRGRLEPVANCLQLQIYVDFAHSDDALLNVLKTLDQMRGASGRLIVVFGCGGDRDRTKRPKMGEVCDRFSDFSIVTSDNPRSEDPFKICQEIAAGFSHSDRYHIEVDRKCAIERAIEIASPDDLILIAGKGHEMTQVFAHQTIEFDDCQVAAEACFARMNRNICKRK